MEKLINAQVKGKVFLQGVKEKITTKVKEFVSDERGEIALKGVVYFAIGMVILVLIFRPALQDVFEKMITKLNSWWSSILTSVFQTPKA